MSALRLPHLLVFALSLVVATQPVLAQSASYRGFDERVGQTALPLWGGVQLEDLAVNPHSRSLEISVPVPMLPNVSFHRQAYEVENSFGRVDQMGGSQTVRAALPFGLTLEAGAMVDGFGNRQNDFVGLTFRWSDLRHHHSRLARYKAGPIPREETSSSGGFPLLKTAGTIALIALLAGGGGGGGGGDPAPNPNPNPGDGTWTLVWSDEFSASVLDTSKWNTTDSYNRPQCFGGYNDEQQCYTSSPNNISIVNGHLVLTARPESGLDEDRTYTSGRIQSAGKGDFTYGKFEARIKLPVGQGSWPAFWMLPTNPSYGGWPESGEIDIMEAINLGVEGERAVHGTAHFGYPKGQVGDKTYLDDINAFHTYAVEWYPNEMRWTIDGTQYASATQGEWYSSGAQNDANAPFDQPFHIILNFAVGGRWPGDTDGTNFPRQMEVDYVRVYQCEGSSASSCKN